MNFFQSLSNFQNDYGNILVIVFLLWTIPWKALGLWHSAKNNEKIWFVAILVINTLGILEIAYLFYFAKPRLTKQKFKEYLDFKR